MSKVIAGTAFVLLAGATATGGVLLAKQSGKPEDNETKPTYDAELPAEKLNEKIHEEGCVKSLFPGLSALPTTQPSQGSVTTTNIAENFFEAQKKTDGCLVVNWDKDTYTSSSNNWRGTFRFLWAVKGDNNKGFLVFLLGTASNSSNKKEIKWEGAAYSLSSTENSAWTVQPNQDTTAASGKNFQKAESGSTDNNVFPQPNDVMSVVPSADFWGWFSSASDLDNICAESACTGTPTKTSMRGYWDWAGVEGEGTDKKSLADWTKEMDKWWKAIFDESKFKAKTLAEKHKGDWINRIKEPKQQASTPSA